MLTKKNWFEVDTAGLRQLQSGKSKTFVLRELIQNALDENIKTCMVDLNYIGFNKVAIQVADDNPEGFKDLTDAYILFKETSKRNDVQKRGRFNLGEKQVFAVCNYAKIITTKGTLVFDKNGRKQTRQKISFGSHVYVELKMTIDEYKECVEFVKSILIPDGIKFSVKCNAINLYDDVEFNLKHYTPLFTFNTSLKTETIENGVFKRVSRKTDVNIHKSMTGNFLYEMGIPVCAIDCDYSIDVQQKIPLSADRDTVHLPFLKDLYAEVLNNMHAEVTNENASSMWVREAIASPRINQASIVDVINKRFGDKVVVANTFDPISIDDAISHGYKVVYGSELSSDEWANIKRYDLLESTTEMFGKDYASTMLITPTLEQARVGEFAKKIAKEFLNFNLSVGFISSPDASTIADYKLSGNSMRFNVPLIKSWSDNGRVSEWMLDLIIHELGHSAGNHTQTSYHDCLTMLGSKLTMKALNQPEWFKL